MIGTLTVDADDDFFKSSYFGGLRDDAQGMAACLNKGCCVRPGESGSRAPKEFLLPPQTAGAPGNKGNPSPGGRAGKSGSSKKAKTPKIVDIALLRTKGDTHMVSCVRSASAILTDAIAKFDEFKKGNPEVVDKVRSLMDQGVLVPE